jgi:RsmE family RNA methyltransferase
MTGWLSFIFAVFFNWLAVQAWVLPHSKKSIRNSYWQTSVCHLNRFLFDSGEVQLHESGNSIVTLPKDDYRTIHAAKTLSLKNGDTVRAGLVSCDKHNGLLTDTAVIEWIPEGKVKKKEPLGNGNPPGSLRIQLDNLSEPPASQEPTVALLLALPRPLQLGRMLPMISQMGVSHLVLSQARKVPKDYFGSHLFRKPEQLRERLIEGLCQAGDVRLPDLHIVKNLQWFLEDDLDVMFPLDKYSRVIAHPQRLSDDIGSLRRMRDVVFPEGTGSSPRRLLLAVGPEGGWEEPDELDRFQKHKFQQITLGSRVLRSDCAVVSLLALAHDACID